MKKGFTLIELLVTIAIIGILSAVILASLQTTEKKTEVKKDFTSEQISKFRH